MSNFKDFASGFLRSANAQYDQKRALTGRIYEEFSANAIQNYQQQMKQAQADEERYEAILAMTGSENHAKATLQAWIANGRNPNEDLRELAGKVKVSKINQNLQARAGARRPPDRAQGSQGATPSTPGQSGDSPNAPQRPSQNPMTPGVGGVPGDPQAAAGGTAMQTSTGSVGGPTVDAQQNTSIFDRIFRGGPGISIGGIGAQVQADLMAGLSPTQRDKMTGKNFQLPSGMTYTVTKPTQYMTPEQLNSVLLAYEPGSPQHSAITNIIKNHVDPQTGLPQVPYASMVDFIGKIDPNAGGGKWDPVKSTTELLSTIPEDDPDRQMLLDAIDSVGGIRNVTPETLMPFYAKRTTPKESGSGTTSEGIPIGASFDLLETTVSSLGIAANNPFVGSQVMRDKVTPALGWWNMALDVTGMDEDFLNEYIPTEVWESQFKEFESNFVHVVTSLREKIFPDDPRLSDQDRRFLQQATGLQGEVSRGVLIRNLHKLMQIQLKLTMAADMGATPELFSGAANFQNVMNYASISGDVNAWETAWRNTDAKGREQMQAVYDVIKNQTDIMADMFSRQTGQNINEGSDEYNRIADFVRYTMTSLNDHRGLMRNDYDFNKAYTESKKNSRGRTLGDMINTTGPNGNIWE